MIKIARCNKTKTTTKSVEESNTTRRIKTEEKSIELGAA